MRFFIFLFFSSTIFNTQAKEVTSLQKECVRKIILNKEIKGNAKKRAIDVCLNIPIKGK